MANFIREIFGKGKSALPNHRLVCSREYEIRYYDKYFVAEHCSSTSNNPDQESKTSDKVESEKVETSKSANISVRGEATSNSFRALARYIGVFSTPENIKKDSISMTAPVLMQSTEKKISPQPESIAMTAPVLMDTTSSMSFILPSTYTSIEEIPVPTNKDIRIKEEPGKYVAVATFNGVADNVKIEAQFESLKAALIRDKFLPSPSSSDTPFCSSDVKWCFAGYNPPFTIPYFRRNEIWINLDNYSKDEEYQNHLNQEKEELTKKLETAF